MSHNNTTTDSNQSKADAFAEQLFRLFAGNERRHVRSFGPPVWDSAKNKWILTVKTFDDPPMLEHWYRHIDHEYTLSVIPLLDDGTCWFACIDCDEYENLDYHQIYHDIKRAQFPLIPVVSKSGGLHLFVFFKEPVSADRVIPALQYMAQRLQLPKYEIFPSSPKVEHGKNTRAVSMPYGPTWDAVASQHGLSPNAMELDHCINEIERSRITANELPEAPQESKSNGTTRDIPLHLQAAINSMGPYPDEDRSRLAASIIWALTDLGFDGEAIKAHVLHKGPFLRYDEGGRNIQADIVRIRDSYFKKYPDKDFKAEILPTSQWVGERLATAPPALVKGLLPLTGVATIGGQSGTGKSFQAIHLGACLIPDCEQEVYIDKYKIKRHGGVLYLVLEGKPAFPLRATTAFEYMLGKQMEFGERGRLPFAWNSYHPNLFEKGSDGLLKLATREAERMRTEFGVDLVAIFLDTMGLAACYENENMAAQIQKVVGGLSRVSDETGALSINVDHMGKDTDAGMRGTSAKRDCVETILACFCDRNNGDHPTNHRMQLLKVRDGEEGRVIPYRLKPMDIGVDEDGEPISTCVVEWEPAREQPRKGKGPRNKQTDLVLEQAIREVGLPADPEALRAVFYRIHGGERKTANQAWNRAINAKGFRLVGGLLDVGG